jgi:hypothetical protein
MTKPYKLSDLERLILEFCGGSTKPNFWTAKVEFLVDVTIGSDAFSSHSLAQSPQLRFCLAQGAFHFKTRQ